MSSNQDDKISKKYPLHLAIWNNNLVQIKRLLSNDDAQVLLESNDNRGRTPLMLSVTLGHKESTKLLIKHNAKANIEDKYGFNVLHEAICSGDSELVRLILHKRDYQRFCERAQGVPLLLTKIRNTPNFYVEMKWNFTSWVPFLSRICPSDTYKIYKSGSCVRIDTSLISFDEFKWSRGSRSYIFKALDNEVQFIKLDHDFKQFHIETITMLPALTAETLKILEPSQEMIENLLNSPTCITYFNTDKITFERAKFGLLGFRNDKNEEVNGHECKVFIANNAQIVTKSRMEHLTKEQKDKHKSSNSYLNFLNSFTDTIEYKHNFSSVPINPLTSDPNPCNPCNITAQQYFDENFDLGTSDIGRLRENIVRIQKFKSTLWFCENYPLSLQQQIFPIIDLMAISSTHFAKLRDFLTLQLPAGFPVKLEIPLLHILNAQITFDNIFSIEKSVEGVIPINDEIDVACVIDENLFDIPSGYSSLEDNQPIGVSYNDENNDELVRMLLNQKDDIDQNQVSFWEAIRNSDTDLQKAIEQCFKDYQDVKNKTKEGEGSLQNSTNTDVNLTSDGNNFSNIANNHICNDTKASQFLSYSDFLSDIERAILLSKQEKEEFDRLQKEEEDLLNLILERSKKEL